MTKLEEMFPNFAEAPVAPTLVHEAELVLPHMRGACVTVDGTVHTLFKYSAPSPQKKKPASL